MRIPYLIRLPHAPGNVRFAAMNDIPLVTPHDKPFTQAEWEDFRADVLRKLAEEKRNVFPEVRAANPDKI